jgi:hypothetical protein
MGAQQSASNATGSPHDRSAVSGTIETPLSAAVAAAACESKSDDNPPRVTGPPVCRVKALSDRMSRALDQLNVFIPPPVQLIIVKLAAISQRGTVMPVRALIIPSLC